jgi:hypothetical protein
MILDLSDDAKEYGRQALRAFEAAGGDQLVQQAEAKPDLRESLAGPALGSSTPAPIPTDSKPPRPCAAAPATGPCRTRSPSASPNRPTSM